MSLPVAAMAAPQQHSPAATNTAKTANTDISAQRRYYRHHYRVGGYRPYRYGYRGWRGHPAYGPYWGPRAYVSLPFFGFSIW
jgi:hypothetical protein